MFTDKSGMFDDFGFKLVVIDSLLDKEVSFAKELDEMRQKYVDDFQGDDGFVCIPEMVEYFENLELTEDDLSKAEELVFDGGEDIYFMIMPWWDGESEEFDVKSVKGFERLKNLKRVVYVGMCMPELMEAFQEKGIELLQ